MDENVTVRGTVERSVWDAMTELQQADYIDKELFPLALPNAGVGGSYKVVNGDKDDDR